MDIPGKKAGIELVRIGPESKFKFKCHKEDADGEGFYFFVNKPHRLGFEENKEWTAK